MRESHASLMGPGAILQLSEGPFEPPDVDAYSDVFVFTPSRAWLRALANRKDFALQPVFVRGQLWSLRRTSSAEAVDRMFSGRGGPLGS